MTVLLEGFAENKESIVALSEVSGEESLAEDYVVSCVVGYEGVTAVINYASACCLDLSGVLDSGLAEFDRGSDVLVADDLYLHKPEGAEDAEHYYQQDDNYRLYIICNAFQLYPPFISDKNIIAVHKVRRSLLLISCSDRFLESEVLFGHKEAVYELHNEVDEYR